MMSNKESRLKPHLVTSRDICSLMKIPERTLLRWMRRETHPFPQSQKPFFAGEPLNWALTDFCKWYLDEEELQETLHGDLKREANDE